MDFGPFGSDPRFNPTLVRLRHQKEEVDMRPKMRFNPTLVRLRRG